MNKILWNKKSRTIRHGLQICSLFAILFCCIFLCSCQKKDDTEKKEKDLEFTIVSDRDIPANLMTIINNRRQEPFQLTYATADTLYLAVGYGMQKTGGYSIQIPACYLTGKHIVLRTELIGPSEGTQVSQLASYPFVVIKTEMVDLPVKFE